MTSITIRNLDKHLKNRLRVRAARHNRSMEEEVRSILNSALSEDVEQPQNLADSIQNRFRSLGGVDIPDIPREKVREPIDFEE